MARVRARVSDEEMKWLEGRRISDEYCTHPRREPGALGNHQLVHRGEDELDEKAMGRVPTFNIVDKGATTQGIMA